MATMRISEEGTIRIPTDVLQACNMQTGDEVALFTDGSTIHIVPTAVYPEEYVETLRAELEEFQSLDEEGRIPEYRSVAELL